MKPDMTVVVVEFFSRPHLDRLAESIHTIEPNLPVLVSSNSRYNLVAQQQIIKDFPRLDWLFNETNLGYAGAVNRALEKIKTKYVAILNPDVELVEPLAEKVRMFFEDDPGLGVFGPLVLDGNGNFTFSFRRFYPPRYILARYLDIFPSETKKRIQDYYLMVDAPRNQFTYTDWISGGAMFIRMDAVHAAGGMDERYFLYMEDMDWCRSMWLAGWHVAYHPGIAVIHRAQHQTTRSGLRKVFSSATRTHLASYAKYLLKWGLSPFNLVENRGTAPLLRHANRCSRRRRFLGE